MDFFKAMLADSEWAKWLDFVSPDFFKVVPSFAMMSEARKLLASGRWTKETKEVYEKISPLSLQSHEKFFGTEDALEYRTGDLALRLYFFNLFSADIALFDVRRSAFPKQIEERLDWKPRPFFAVWDPEFLSALRAIYLSFYGDDHQGFTKALQSLNLEAAEPELRKHFGADDQRAVAFSLAKFRSSFHDVFVACRRHQLRLHPQFLPLGAFLFALYQHLEELGKSWDVRKIFWEVISETEYRSAP